MSPQSNSETGSHPATSAYQATHCSRDGRPGVCAEDLKAGFVRGNIALLGGSTAKVKGVKRLERSDNGWPIVDISQLRKIRKTTF